MKKMLVILLLIIAGLAFWVYLLIGRNAKEEEAILQPQTTSREDRPTQKAPDMKVPPPPADLDAHSGTDAGMEFPTLE